MLKEITIKQLNMTKAMSSPMQGNAMALMLGKTTKRITDSLKEFYGNTIIKFEIEQDVDINTLIEILFNLIQDEDAYNFNLRSMMVGDIVCIDDVEYMYKIVGYAKLD